jgi:hypothetical protein
MVDDPKKPASADRLSSSKSDALMEDAEQKFKEVRRHLSLHNYAACEALLLQVLEADPQNTKAKRLLELAAIKLSRRKLYEKIVDPQLIHGNRAPANPSQTAESGFSLEANQSSPTYLQQAGETENLVQEGQQEGFSYAERSSPNGARQIDSDPPPRSAGSQMDSMRERTIAALVQLFNEKEKTLADWQDPRFRPPESETKESEPRFHQASPRFSGEETGTPTISLPRPEIVEEIRQLKVESDLQASTDSFQNLERVEGVAQSKGKILEPAQFPDTLSKSSDSKRKVIQLPSVSPFDRITTPRKTDYRRLVEKKLEERSEDLRNSEIKTVSIAQIKKYLYREEYELCALELEKIQKLFPNNAEIQSFVENTSKRLSELQRIKSFEILARDLMLAASFHYQEGKLPEALIATNEVLRVIPDHQQAKQFAEFVQKRLDREKRKSMGGDKIRHCWACGVAVDSKSVFCFHCGHRLS